MRHLAALVLAALFFTGCAGRTPVPVIAVPIPKTEAITKAITELKKPIQDTRKATQETADLAKELAVEAPPETPFQLKAIELEAKARAGAQLAVEAEAKYDVVVKENTLLNADVAKAQKIANAAQKQSAQFQADKLAYQASSAFWRKWCLIGWAIICMTLAGVVLAFLYRTSITAAIKGAKFGI